MKIIRMILRKNRTIIKMYSILHQKILKIAISLSPVLASKYIYKKVTGDKLNLDNPENFNEKIQWLKLYWQHPLVVKCADKYEVREYIKEIGCSQILNDLHFVYENVDEIEWELLPSKFALKTTNGCDTYIVTNDKHKIDRDEALLKLKKWMKIDFGIKHVELHYLKMKPRIICERYLETEAGLLPLDYKFFCFNGEPKYLYVGLIDETGYTHKTFYDLNWNKQDFLKEGYLSYDHEKPSCFQEMIEYARIISKPFPFVRVDLYNLNGRPIFGEMTFTPTGGLSTYYREEANKMLGSLIDLPDKKIFNYEI